MVGKKEKQGFKAMFKRMLASRLAAGIAAALAALLLLVIVGLGIRSVVLSESKSTKLGFENIGELATQTAYCTSVNVTEGSRELFGVTILFTQTRIWPEPSGSTTRTEKITLSLCSVPAILLRHSTMIPTEIPIYTTSLKSAIQNTAIPPIHVI